MRFGRASPETDVREGIESDGGLAGLIVRLSNGCIDIEELTRDKSILKAEKGRRYFGCCFKVDKRILTHSRNNAASWWRLRVNALLANVLLVLRTDFINCINQMNICIVIVRVAPGSASRYNCRSLSCCTYAVAPATLVYFWAENWMDLPSKYWEFCIVHA